MTQDQKTPTLATIFSDVLANLAFMFNDGEDADMAAAAGEVWWETRIGYRGPNCGTLRFWCTHQFAVELAANLLGIDHADQDAESGAVDAAKEFMNVVCGQVITAWFGTSAVYDLTIPTQRELAQMPEFLGHDDPNVATLFVEGQKLQLLHQPGGEPARED